MLNNTFQLSSEELKVFHEHLQILTALRMGSKYCHPCVRDEEAESPTDQVTCSGS